jgi:hypothetical protein
MVIHWPSKFTESMSHGYMYVFAESHHMSRCDPTLCVHRRLTSFIYLDMPDFLRFESPLERGYWVYPFVRRTLGWYQTHALQRISFCSCIGGLNWRNHWSVMQILSLQLRSDPNKIWYRWRPKGKFSLGTCHGRHKEHKNSRGLSICYGQQEHAANIQGTCNRTSLAWLRPACTDRQVHTRSWQWHGQCACQGRWPRANSNTTSYTVAFCNERLHSISSEKP